MPHRLVSFAILLAWAMATAGLLLKDVLPELLVGPSPDLLDVASSTQTHQPSTWTILVVDPGTQAQENYRAVGYATTKSTRQDDGHTLIKSEVQFDSGKLLVGTPFEASTQERIEVLSTIDIDSLGNLNRLRSGVRLQGDSTDLLVIDGHLEADHIVVTIRSPLLPLGELTKRLKYESQGMVQNALAPLDRIPGLHVGQRWDSRVVNPLTGRAERVYVEVVDQNVMIPWGDDLIPTHELLTKSDRMSARTWARTSDGLVIRQEVPLLFVTLMLERQPARDTNE